MSLFALEIAILAFMHLCHEIIADFNATYFSVYPEVVFSLFMPNIYVFIFKFSCYVRAGGNIFFKETVDEISCYVKQEYCPIHNSVLFLSHQDYMRYLSFSI